MNTNIKIDVKTMSLNSTSDNKSESLDNEVSSTVDTILTSNNKGEPKEISIIDDSNQSPTFSKDVEHKKTSSVDREDSIRVINVLSNKVMVEDKSAIVNEILYRNKEKLPRNEGNIADELLQDGKRSRVEAELDDVVQLEESKRHKSEKDGPLTTDQLLLKTDSLNETLSNKDCILRNDSKSSLKSVQSTNNADESITNTEPCTSKTTSITPSNSEKAVMPLLNILGKSQVSIDPQTKMKLVFINMNSFFTR